MLVNKAIQRPGQFSEPLFSLHTFRVWGDGFTIFSQNSKDELVGCCYFYSGIDDEEEIIVDIWKNEDESKGINIPVKAPWEAIFYVKEDDLPLYLKKQLVEYRKR